ncbi:IS1380 family transposase, partial [Gordonia sp. TBRC 11910]
MQSTSRFSTVTEVFDDEQIVPASGLHPAMRLLERAGLTTATTEHLQMTGVGKANPAAKVATLVAAMCTGVDTIDGVDALRTGATRRAFTDIYAPSTLGTFLRSMTDDNAAQWDMIASQVVIGLAKRAPLLTPARRGSARSGPGRHFLMLDIDDTVLPVRSNKEHVGHTYRRCQGLSVQFVTASLAGSRPVMLSQELRDGVLSGKPSGSKDLVATALANVAAAFPGPALRLLLRGDSAYYSADLVAEVLAAGGYVSVGIRRIRKVVAAIATIDDDAWQPIDYPGAVRDPDTAELHSDAHVAELPFTAFTGSGSAKSAEVPGRLVIRRIVRLTDADALMPVYDYHAFFTNLPADQYSTVDVDTIHRGHAIIEQVNSDLKDSALAHLPTARFAANTAWVHLAAMAYNTLRATAALTTTLANATSSSIRHKLINVPARLTL